MAPSTNNRVIVPGLHVNDLPVGRDDIWAFADRWISDNAAHMDTFERDLRWNAIVAAVNPAWAVTYSERLRMQRPQPEVRQIRPDLWAMGPVDAIDLDHVVAVIGSRACTAYGEQVASDFAHDFANQGWHVVTGGGFGIETAALRGALAARNTPPVIWSATDFGTPYPPANSSLFDQVIDAGGVILSHNDPALGRSYPTRASLLARTEAMLHHAQATVVVEAAYRSSAGIIAARTTTPLFGVPGIITSAHSTGVHELIRTGRARLVTAAADVLSVLEGGE